MSHSAVNYFHADALRQRYVDGLAVALQAGRLDAQEHQWLQALTLPQAENADDPSRVDRLLFNQGTARSFELVAALLVSHALTDVRKVYLFTLMWGVEAFDDLTALLSRLRERFAPGEPETVFEREKIEGEPFQAQMLAIVDYEVTAVGELTDLLRRMPALADAATASITRELQQAMPRVPLDPATHLLQIAPFPEDAANPDLVVQTLAQAALDDCCKVPISEGFARRFLDMRGDVSSAADSALFAKAFTDATAAVGLRYGELLAAFWARAAEDGNTRRQQICQAFSASVRRELYRRGHQGALRESDLNALLGLVEAVQVTEPVSGAWRCKKLSIRVGESQPFELASTFILAPAPEVVGPILWFSTEHKLISYTDVTALGEFFTSVPGRQQLRGVMALEDQQALSQEGPVHVALHDITGLLAADRIDSVIALQARNLAFAMTLKSPPENVTAMIDDALDIRQLLDPRQMQFSARRWRQASALDFAQVWLTPATTVPATGGAPASDIQSAAVHRSPGSHQSMPGKVPASVGSEPRNALTTSWVEYVQAFDARAEQLTLLNDVLPAYAEQVVGQYLCVWIAGSVSVGDFQVQWLEPGPDEHATVDTDTDTDTDTVTLSESRHLMSTDLLSLLLEYVIGHRTGSLPRGAQVKVGLLVLSGEAHVRLVNHMLERAAARFIEQYLGQYKASRLEAQRCGDMRLVAADVAMSIREDTMRLDLTVAVRQARLDVNGMNMALQVLDRPDRRLRVALQGPATEAYSILLAFDEGANVALGDTVVLEQLQNEDSPVLLWSCEFGWRQFSSLESLQQTLRYNLYGTHRERWLELLGERDRKLLRNHLLKPQDNQLSIRMERIDGHLTQVIQQRALERQAQNLRQLCLRAVRGDLETQLFTRLAGATEFDWQLSHMLDGLSIRIDNSIFEAMLPGWIKQASGHDLMLYYRIFRRYYQASDGGKDFLYDIPTLQDLTSETLLSRLNQDHPAEQWDPEQIKVISRRYVSAFPSPGELPSAVPAATITRSESLTDYAINRFVDAQDAALQVSYTARPAAEHLLTPDYVRQLVRQVDVGSAYTTLLRKAFSPDEPQFASRKRFFVEQLPPALLAVALPEKVQGKLSSIAFEYIARVLEMPDGIAREPVDGTRVVISPLQLVADAGMTPDKVTGMFLICPAGFAPGPVVLYAIYHPEFVFREYASHGALMDDIRNTASLQQLLLERLDPEVHRRYAHGGFVEPHLPFSVEGFLDVPRRAPGPVTAHLEEITGNALQAVFSGTLKLLLDMGVSNSVSNAQADQAGRRFLATLAVSQALTLLPSKLATLVTLWQSHTLFRASAMSVSGHRWGQALSEFTAALGVMATAREQTLEESPSETSIDDSADATGDESARGTSTPWAESFSWHTSSLTTDQRLRLQTLEARNVALNEMHHDALLNVFIDPKSDTPYAVVSGRVYQVQRQVSEGKWRIVGPGGAIGPQLMLNENQHWQLELDLRLRGGGGLQTRVMETASDASAEGGLVIEARGMSEIRQFYRDRARRIGEAHLQAKKYLENSLDNLTGDHRRAPLDPRVAQIIEEFFGVINPDQALLTEVSNAVRSMFDAIMDASLSPLSSPRFVIGANRPGRSDVTAFIVPGDPLRRLFLTERFFRTPLYRLTPAAVSEGFEPTAHFQAATLLHELSHQVLDTKDIAYLESNAPYPDLLRGDTAPTFKRRSQLERLQDYRLSHRTHKHELFTQYEDGRWRDVTREDALGFSSILRITGAKTLDEARDIFLTNPMMRTRILLKNADSVTLLLLRLGRQNFVVPTS